MHQVIRSKYKKDNLADLSISLNRLIDKAGLTVLDTYVKSERRL